MMPANVLSRCNRSGQIFIVQKTGHLIDFSNLLVGYHLRGIRKGGQDVFPHQVVLLHGPFHGLASGQLADDEGDWNAGSFDDGFAGEYPVIDDDSGGDLDHWRSLLRETEVEILSAPCRFISITAMQVQPPRLSVQNLLLEQLRCLATELQELVGPGD